MQNHDSEFIILTGTVETTVEKALRKSGAKAILVAVSGGADSVALLRACRRVAPRLDLYVEAVNCNFHLRGDESDRDSAFVAGLCRQLGIRLHSLHYDVAEYIRLHPGTSTEMACRDLRYADFRRLARERNFDRIAVAHNADDDVETLLLNLLRGSGTKGLKGMDPDNGYIIRPLLSVSRAEIEKYLDGLGQDYVTDSSNLSSDYRRNFLRREVIPMFEKRWPGTRKALRRSLSILKEEARIVDCYYDIQLEELADGNSLEVYQDDVSTGTVLKFIRPFGGNSATAEEIIEAVGKPFAKRIWKLADNYTATLERHRLIISGADNNDDDNGIRLSWTRMEMNTENMKKVKENRSHYIAYLPDGPEAYEIRKPRQGDRIAPLGMKGSRLVSDVISDAKLSGREKASVRVLARISDGKIVWIPGLKRSRLDLIGTDCGCFFKTSIEN